MKVPICRGPGILIRNAVPTGVLLVGISLLGCDFFSPRNPQNPDVGEAVQRHVPSEPESVLFNIEAAYAGKSAGLQNYEEAISDSFTFLPAPTDLASLGAERYENWTKAVEVDVTRRIFLNSSDLELTFTRVEPTILSSEEEEYRDMPYRLLFLGATGDTLDRYSGLTDLLMTRGEGGLWSVRRLVDKQDQSGDATWGNLKGSLRL